MSCHSRTGVEISRRSLRRQHGAAVYGLTLAVQGGDGDKKKCHIIARIDRRRERKTKTNNELLRFFAGISKKIATNVLQLSSGWFLSFFLSFLPYSPLPNPPPPTLPHFQEPKSALSLSFFFGGGARVWTVTTRQGAC